jgi:hypothetical protein
MKKTLLLTALVGICGLVRATTINAPSSLIGTSVLDGNNAYSWGISIAVPTGQVVSSAQIDFTGIILTAGNGTGTDNLYTDLLNTHTTGVTTKVDNDAPLDYWATQLSGANITTIGTRAFTALNVAQSWTYLLTSTQLTALNSYLAAGSFNIGIDPDCHFTVGGLSFSYTLAPKTNTVPDDAMTAFLVVLSLAGLEIFRRQFAMAKSKA